MEDDLYLECGGTSRFRIQSSGSRTQQIKMHDVEYTLTETGYKITSSENSTLSTTDMFVATQSEDSTMSRTQFHILDCRKYALTLDSWLAQNQTIQSELYCVKDTKGNDAQIMRPTKHGLAIIKSIIKAVTNLHSQDCCLSYPVTFGVNTLSTPSDNYCEVEVIIDQGNLNSDGPPSLERDLAFLEDLIFNQVLRPPQYFSNLKSNMPPPRLPSGLLDLKRELTTNTGQGLGVRTLNHYSLKNWELRRQQIKSQHDGALCMLPNHPFQWRARIPQQGVLCKFYNDTNLSSMGSSMTTRVLTYRDSKGELLRFMRNFLVHVGGKEYCDDDHKSLEYVETQLSEIFHDYYMSYF